MASLYGKKEDLAQMSIQPVLLGYEIDLKQGDQISLPPEISANLAPGRWIVSIRPKSAS